MTGRHALTIAALLALWADVAAAAPRATSADAAAIDAGVTAGKGAACIGIIADPCIAKVKECDDATAAARACSARELAVWTARMQRAFEIARRSGGRETAAALAASQKSFTEAVNRLCPVFDRLDPGMSLGGSDYCRLHETAARALMLEWLADAVSPH